MSDCDGETSSRDEQETSLLPLPDGDDEGDGEFQAEGKEPSSRDVGNHSSFHVSNGSISASGGVTAHSQRQHTVNVVILSFCFSFTFTAFQSLQNLQASLNKSGKTCLAVLYGALGVSCFLTPPLVQRLSPKVTIALCMVVHCVFTAANYYPVDYVLVPACGLLGLASAPLWTAQQTYLTSSAHLHAAGTTTADGNRRTRSADDSVSKFNGIFFLIIQCTQVVGNLISSLVLHQSRNADPDNGGNVSNETRTCDFTDTSNSSSLEVSDPVRYTLLSVYLACDVAGVLLCLVCLRPLAKSVSQYVARDWKSTCLATLRRMIDPVMMLLIPVVVFSGLEKAFIFSEFTKHFIADCLGIGWVGYVMLLFGAVNAACSMACSKMVSRLGRVPILITGALANAGVLIFLLIWVRVPSLLVVFILAALWGFVDAVWTIQMNTLFGILFSADQEAAFSNYRLWQAIGFCVSFGISDVLAMSTKLWILVGLLGMSVALYLTVELKHRLTQPERDKMK